MSRLFREGAVVEERSASISVGVVVRRRPGATRWAKWAWRAVAIVPGVVSGRWRELHREGDAVDYLAATVTLTLHRGETDDYLAAISNDPSTVYVVMRATDDSPVGCPYDVHAVMASPYEAHDDSGVDAALVEPVPMPPFLADFVGGFVERHHKDTPFVKRKPVPALDGRVVEDGRGDARVRQDADVYRSPGSRRRENGK